MARLRDLYKTQIVGQLIKEFNYPNPMAVPKMENIVISMGVGYKVFNLFDVEIGLDIRQKGDIDIETPFESGPEAVALASPSGDYPG